jgi:hypothetical protein
MHGTFRRGDRVRVTGRYRLTDYAPGDGGTVLREAFVIPGGVRYYAVAMDKDGPGAACVVFAEEEIEPDT